MIRFAVIVLLLWSSTIAPAAAGPLWTFCVASALGSKDVWITDLFSAATNRDRLERELKSLLERRGHARIVAQCPEPTDDKVAVVNAQTTAEEFNRKLGSAMHSVPAQEFPGRP
ncbi:MAG TPA: hypothetical protein VKS78_04365 [Roseiarcus sp.]|nr:hypothetical protein [Roseiarcus sp.]